MDTWDIFISLYISVSNVVKTILFSSKKYNENVSIHNHNNKFCYPILNMYFKAIIKRSC